MISFIKNHYINLKLNTKILIITSLTTSLFFALMIYIGVKTIIPAYNNTLYENISSNLLYSSVQIESSLESAVALSNIMLADSSIQTNLGLLQSGTPLNLSIYSALYNTVQNFYTESKIPIVSHITLLSGKYTVQSYPTANNIPYDVRRHINNLSISANGGALWITDYCEDYGLFLSRVIRKIDRLELSHLGILTLTIDLSPILDWAFNSDYYQNAYCLLYDDDNLIYRTKKTNLNVSIENLNELSGPYDFITIDNHQYFVTKGTLTHYGWDYFILINLDDINHSIHISKISYFIIIFLCFLLNILLCHRLLQPITTHLNYLIKRMKQFGSSKDLSVDNTFQYTCRKDEIGMLHQQFYSMATEIQDLIKFNYLNQLLLKDAELKALENQINPHFLYNTLDFINWRAKQIGESEISLMVQSLGNLLRLTLNNNSINSTLGAEINLVNAYITIQQIRFEERLIFSMEIDDSFYNIPMPKITLQPIVESAIVYGLEKMIDPCTITIKAIKNNTTLNIYIKHNGPLFEDNLLEKLKFNEYNSSELGIGLQNIDERLKLFFGNDFGLTLYNEDHLAVVKICIPINTENSSN